jgi:16S rRNA (adenine1518-N6/adenine1519-N6)-dimethyltransferase
MAGAAAVDSRDSVFEIGAGLGDLTEVLAARASRVEALEVDPKLVAELRRRFELNPRVRIAHEDALRWPLPDALEKFPRPRKVIGNLPYNVATQIVLQFCRFPREVDLIVVMLQKEVADRIVAAVGTSAYGVITLLIRLEWEARIVFTLPPRAFHPAPKVTSSLVSLSPLPEPRDDVGNRECYRLLVKAAFGQRRKMLKNALRGMRTLELQAISEILAAAGIEGNRRAETLALEEFARLSRIFSRASGA